jgi:hypothetical protein
VYNSFKKAAFIKSYETLIMIHKTNTDYLQQTLFLTQKTPENTINNNIKTNNAAVYPEAKTAICSNISIAKFRLNFRIKDVFRFEKYYRIGKFSF